jgi:succinate dehydrogenase / fumarate reductase membrane anchor subunit
MSGMTFQQTRTRFAHARGFGSAKSGARTWWAERLSAVALVPLMLWFVAALIMHTTADYAAFVAWMRSPATLILMVLLIAMLFHHTALGLQVIVEDYVHSGLKFAALMAVRLGCYAAAGAGIVATLAVAFMH